MEFWLIDRNLVRKGASEGNPRRINPGCQLNNPQERGKNQKQRRIQKGMLALYKPQSVSPLEFQQLSPLAQHSGKQPGKKRPSAVTTCNASRHWGEIGRHEAKDRVSLKSWITRSGGIGIKHEALFQSSYEKRRSGQDYVCRAFSENPPYFTLKFVLTLGSTLLCRQTPL